jgi:predicted MPP superfamily phosphohydrolase
MKILLITDIHYGEDTNTPHIGGEKYINSFGSQFEKFLLGIKKLVAEHDLVINLGDLIRNLNNEQDFTRYKKAMKLLDMGKPVGHVMGNHDFSFIPRSRLAEFIGRDKSYYSFDLVDIIMLY